MIIVWSLDLQYITIMEYPIIKKVEEADVPDLIRIARSTFVHTYRHLNDPVHFDAYMNTAMSEEQLRDEVSDPNSLFYVLKSPADIIGYLKLNRKEAQTEADMDDALEIERIYVIQSRKGEGLGARLIQKAKEVAVEEGCTMLWLGVWDQNHDAQGFYTRQGFQPFGTHDFMMGSDRQTDILMKLVL